MRLFQRLGQPLGHDRQHDEVDPVHPPPRLLVARVAVTLSAPAHLRTSHSDAPRKKCLADKKGRERGEPLLREAHDVFRRQYRAITVLTTSLNLIITVRVMIEEGD